MNEETTATKCETGRKNTIIQVLLCMLVGMAILLLGTLGVYKVINKKQSYTPPKFDTNASVGVPSTNNSSFSYLETKFGFKVGICGCPYFVDKSLVVEFANPQSNNEWLMLAVFDKSGKQELTRTGIIKPGEYVSSVDLKTSLSGEISYKVYAFTPDTYVSEGCVTLGNINVKQ